MSVLQTLSNSDTMPPVSAYSLSEKWGSDAFSPVRLV